MAPDHESGLVFDAEPEDRSLDRFMAGEVHPERDLVTGTNLTYVFAMGVEEFHTFDRCFAAPEAPLGLVLG